MLLSRELVASLLLGVVSPVAAVWPIPQSMSTGNTSLLINQDIVVTYNRAPVRWLSFSSPVAASSSPSSIRPVAEDADDRYGQCSNPNNNRVFLQTQLVYTYGYEPFDVHNSAQIVQAGVSRALSAIFQNGLVPWKLHRKNSLPSVEPNLFARHPWVASLAITQTARDAAAGTFRPRDGDVDESYNLTLSAAGHATLTAVSSTGVLRGLETFVQLFYQHSSGTAWYTPLAPVAIADAPRYPHRGLMLDVARNWYDVKHLYRTLDALAMNKMNRLHLHATDSQSWPLEIPSMPEVATQGAYRADLTYGADDLDALQRYATARGIELVVEIDMPGHIGSLAWSHPELIVAYDAFPYSWWCAEPPCGAFKLNNTGVDAFLDRLFDDLLPRVAPYAAYFHTGGDELNLNDSRLDPDVGTNDTGVLLPLLQAFVSANHARVRKHGLAPMVWEEIPLTFNVTLGNDTVVQTWLSDSSVQAVTARGLRVIDSNYNYWYLDCGRSQWINFDNGAAYATYYPFGDWCDPYKNWQLVYAHDPAHGLTAAEARLVLGGEVALWSETADGTNLDTLVWPRASAAGEVLWSGNKDPVTGQNRSQMTVTPRLNEWRERMVRRGVMAAPIQPIWCMQADNSTECSQPVGPGF
ncbi:beta-hexosaminidase beta chain precursor [Niveomyces insectorum RCEF 264]|uniref:Beta-hexosaminidase n=1 Tax=Niveomyces insectorum RCEF 264 TaxID=1081102 RepID=A0A162IBE3_9HYPO|nr:beta-hexosaminidase beta chain precursor [Niveomyces insectorum RCEF 264]